MYLYNFEFIYFHLFIYTFIYLFICLFIYLFIYLSTLMFMYFFFINYLQFSSLYCYHPVLIITCILNQIVLLSHVYKLYSVCI